MFSIVFVFFKQKTAYELRISDWSSDVCSSDLVARLRAGAGARPGPVQPRQPGARRRPAAAGPDRLSARLHRAADAAGAVGEPRIGAGRGRALPAGGAASTEIGRAHV